MSIYECEPLPDQCPECGRKRVEATFEARVAIQKKKGKWKFVDFFPYPNPGREDYMFFCLQCGHEWSTTNGE